MEKLKQDLIKFLKDYLKESGKQGYTLGVSGGLDSAVCAKLLIEGNIPATFVIMPCGESMKDSEDRAYNSISDSNNIHNIMRINIKDILTAYDSYLSYIDLDIETNYKWAIANLQSRIRTNLLYTIAQSKNQLVLGTTNKSENFIGYFTKGGDGLSDLEPLINIPKTYLFKFAKYLGVDLQIVNAKPAAELGISETDEEEMGFTYVELDNVIADYENGVIPNSVIANTIIKKHKQTQFKRELPKTFEFKNQ